MPKLIGSATPISSVGNMPKVANEYVGLVNTGERAVSITLVQSPSGWKGLGQYADYREYRVVFGGVLHVEHSDGDMDIQVGQGLEIEPGEWVQYSTPGSTGAQYVTVCIPAFSPAGIHRDK